MKRTNANEYKAAVYAYLIDCMNDDEAGDMTPAQKVAWIATRVRSELDHVVKRSGLQTACTDWLQGLGMGIDYMNYQLPAIAAKLHGCELSEKDQQTVIDNWFPHMGYKLAELIRYVERGGTKLLPEHVEA